MQRSLKELRLRYGKSLQECAAALGLDSAEGYRLKEIGKRSISGAELALLADFYGAPLEELFPDYTPTAGEQSLARHLTAAA